MKDLIVLVVEPVLSMGLLTLLVLGVVACFSRNAADSIVNRAKQLSPAGWMTWVVGASLVGVVLMEQGG